MRETAFLTFLYEPPDPTSRWGLGRPDHLSHDQRVRCSWGKDAILEKVKKLKIKNHVNLPCSRPETVILWPLKWAPRAFWLESSFAWDFRGLRLLLIQPIEQMSLPVTDLPWSPSVRLGGPPSTQSRSTRLDVFVFLTALVATWNCLCVCLAALFNSKLHEGAGSSCLSCSANTYLQRPSSA